MLTNDVVSFEQLGPGVFVPHWELTLVVNQLLHGALSSNTTADKKSRARLFKTNDVFVNVSLKFQTLISQICQYFFMKKLLSFFQ